jgi:ATP-dependent DNA helicase RecG
MDISCAFLSGTAKTAQEKKEKKEALRQIKCGEVQVIIGTHNTFSKEVEYKNLGLIVYDEEQIFGVDHKIAMFEKGLPGVHTIEMSATPIPRSLSMSVYGNKRIYRIAEKPAGRVPVQTAAWSYDRPGAVTSFMEKQLAMGRQCYVVAPAIEDNEDAGLVGVNTIAEKYHDHFAPLGYQVVIANGRMKDEEFTKAIDSFKSGEAQILVATTVVEVGVNVPNATVIIIEQAERFGLSQLHQLRGRVGRRDYKSYCVLYTNNKENERIVAMERITDGFEIAEEDCRLRGPGDVNGTDQSGQNTYIEEVLTYPHIYEKAKKAVDLCTDENRYGIMLKLMYTEHENADGN